MGVGTVLHRRPRVAVYARNARVLLGGHNRGYPAQKLLLEGSTIKHGDCQGLPGRLRFFSGGSSHGGSTHAKNRDVAGVLTKGVAPALGMAMVWPLLRYASFFRLLYPVGPRGSASAARGLTAHGVVFGDARRGRGRRRWRCGIGRTRACCAVAGCAGGARDPWRRWVPCWRSGVEEGGPAAVGPLGARSRLRPWASWPSTSAWGSYMAGLMAGGEAPAGRGAPGAVVCAELRAVLARRARGVVGRRSGRRRSTMPRRCRRRCGYCSRPAVPLGLVDGGERFVPASGRHAAAHSRWGCSWWWVVPCAGSWTCSPMGAPGRQFSMEASLLVAAVCRCGGGAVQARAVAPNRVGPRRKRRGGAARRGLLDGVCPAVPWVAFSSFWPPTASR